ncbi:MAG: hypothetical protein JNG84_11860 [Archangium sp.]|nr:hypothetical protein [Archangium sp.]
MRVWVVICGVAAGACVLNTDPGVGRYSCAAPDDCGDGFVCVAQFALDGGRCFRAGECTAEACNGSDDNCDGRVDEGFDLTSDSAHCGTCANACGAGTACQASTCREATCGDGVDNDSNGRADCADDACFKQACATGKRCGATLDGGVLDAGSVYDAGIRGCFGPEATCDDGLDNDGDGNADCHDADCAGLTCGSGRQCRDRACAP